MSDEFDPPPAAIYEALRNLKNLPPGVKQILLRDEVAHKKLREPLEKEFDPIRGEAGLAEVFVLAATSKYLYSRKEKMWLYYDDGAGIWVDGYREARELVKRLMHAAVDVVTKQLSTATKNLDADAQKAARAKLAAVTRLQRSSTIDAVLAAAHTSETLHVDGMDAFNTNPDLICVENGVINLRTGKLLPHDPAYRMRKSLAVRYDPQAKAPRWKQFLSEVFSPSAEGRCDEELINYFRLALGYTLTGHVVCEVMFVMYGTGRNGKSVIANLLNRMMSSYVVNASGDFLMVAKNAANNRESASPTMASLAGARLLLVNEVEENAEFSSQQIKNLVSTERLAARKLHSDRIEFDPTHKLWARLNQKPIVKDVTTGFWRRIGMIPFLRQFTKAEEDPELLGKLLVEKDGILAWMVEGAKDWYAAGMKLPDCRTVREATDAYCSESDLLTDWFKECFVADKTSYEAAATVYHDYSEWCRNQGVGAMSRPSLTRKLAAMGVKTKKMRRNGYTTPTSFYVGMRYRGPTDPVDGEATTVAAAEAAAVVAALGFAPEGEAEAVAVVAKLGSEVEAFCPAAAAEVVSRSTVPEITRF